MPRLSKIGAAALAAFGWTGISSVTATYLVVAGGGGGGSFVGGGGGGGGYRTGTTSLNPTLSYTVTVGAGGGGGIYYTSQGSNGGDSVFNAVTSTGGGGGGSGATGTASYAYGRNGGSGGGAAYDGSTNIGLGNTPSTSPSQGNNGGTGLNSGTNNGGGGGGASAVGGNGTSNNGGAGSANSISGSSVTYAGGGGGAADLGGSAGTGGSGGGGNGGGARGASGTSTAGTANLGGGGGGSPINSTPGQNGGSGIVIISYTAPQKFSGGVVTLSGGNVIHTFNTSGTLGPITTLSASYLIVAGGGGGGTGLSNSTIGSGGGGGAGGMQTGSGLTIDPNSTYLVTVGAGGSGGVANTSSPTSGSNSSFSMVSTASVGGGLGGSYGGSNAATGGSGGGGNYGSPSGAAGTAGQGNTGGNAYTVGAYYGNGGGGGAGGAGGSAGASTLGNGGVGSTSSISGTLTYYAGGGGGGSGQTAGGASTGGTGGGGAGGYGTVAGVAGTANLGGGGGGGGNQGVGGTASSNGGNGGSGVVIISYPGSTQQMAGGTVTISGGNVIHTFTSTGYLAPIKYVSNSLRFRSSATAYLSRTLTTPTSNTTWTYSLWVKRGALSTNQGLLSAGTSAIEFVASTDTLRFYASGPTTVATSTAVFRDPSAWYHFVISSNGTTVTAYTNNVSILSYTGTLPQINSAIAHTIGSYAGGGDQFDGYMTEINFVDGQALTPNSFGTFNSYGVWQPITYGGSYGTNGFYLPMNPNTSTYAGLVSNSDYLTAPSNAAFAVGTSDFTMETWFYPTNSSQSGQFMFVASGGIQMGYQNSTTWGLCQANVAWQTTTNTLPTTNAWNHMAITRSGTTVGLFLNGVRLTTGTISTNYSQNTCVIGQGIIGYMSNTRFVKGTAVYNPANATYTVPTSPLTNITNTSLLTFQNSTNIDNSSNAFTLTATGTVKDYVAYPFNLNSVPDYGPAGNNWIANNIQPVGGSNMDYMTDVPTLTSATAANYAVLNPIQYYTSGGVPIISATVTDGNLKTTGIASSNRYSGATIIPASGKYYCEWAIGATQTTNYIGFLTINGTLNYTIYYANGNVTKNTGSAGTGATYTAGDVIGVAWDVDNGAVTFYKNGVSQSALTGVTDLNRSVICIFQTTNTDNATVNFGQQPFTYTPPSGFVALNTYNM